MKKIFITTAIMCAMFIAKEEKVANYEITNTKQCEIPKINNMDLQATIIPPIAIPPPSSKGKG